MELEQKDKEFMAAAIILAKTAAINGEVPVGALLVKDDVIVAKGANAPIASHDPTAHAEIIALRKGGQHALNYRLPDTTLYVTLEPCIMCMGAIIQARVNRLVFGAYDPKTGAAVSRYTIGADGLLNHHLEITGGIYEEECSTLLKAFFRKKRQRS